MDLIWSLEPVNSTALSKLCLERFGWKKPTTYNLLRKLGGGASLRNEAATVTALVKREQVRQYESEAVVEKSFGGSLPPSWPPFSGAAGSLPMRRGPCAK